MVAASLALLCGTAARAERTVATAGVSAATRPAAQVPSCPTGATAPSPALQRLGRDLWWLPGLPDADADASNRGRIDNLLIARHGRRLWLLGSGPSAAAGAALDCQLRAQLGRRATDVIAPWPHPELVLGQAGLPRARAWAHADVAQAMAQRCGRCEARLRQRLGAAATDLGDTPVRLPQRLLSGDSGTLGPWRWWRLWRSSGAEATPVTVWWHAPSGIFSAPGLLWGGGTPDLRDTDGPAMASALSTLVALGSTLTAAPTSTPALRWLPGQGDLLDADAPQQQLAYGIALGVAVQRAQEAGQEEAAPPLPLDGVGADLQAGARHTLNWQRRWRELEAAWFDQPPR